MNARALPIPAPVMERGRYAIEAWADERIGTDGNTYDIDPDDAWTVEIYGPADANGSCAYVGRISLFTHTLHIEPEVTR